MKSLNGTVANAAREETGSGTVVFICGFRNESIARERGLPSLNVAGTNRAARLAAAIQSTGANVYVLSTATTLRQKWTGTLCHKQAVVRHGRIPVLFTWSVGVPYLSSLFEPLAMLLAVRAVCRRHTPAIGVVYDYDPSSLLGGAMTKWCYGAKLLLDVEDVSQPRLADWIGRGDARPLLQVVGWLLLKLGVSLSDCVLVASRRFLETAQINKKHVVVTGCIESHERTTRTKKPKADPLRVLVSGTLDDEQGLSLFLNAVEELTGLQPSKREMEFHLCGFADDDGALRERIGSIARRGARISYHGTVSRDAYLELLLSADVCVSMQKPHGRHSKAKSPSKVYEYMAHGKVVIVSDVGDFKEIPGDAISVCDWEVKALSDRLRRVANDWDQWNAMGQRALEFAQEEFSLRAVGQRIIRSVAAGASFGKGEWNGSFEP